MGFNRRILCKEMCFLALTNSSLKNLYGKSDMLIFEDKESSDIYDLYKKGHSDQEIAKKYNLERVITEHN